MHSEEHKWFIEHTSSATAHMFEITNYLKCMKTDYQQVEIADTELFGRILVLDGKIQSSEYDEYMYHEALVQPAMLICPAPRRVLVVGGGEGATLREVFKHGSVERLVMVDLDRQVVESCRELLGNWHQGSFEDKRLELIFADAREYLDKSDERFDVIISDVPEPVGHGPATKLFTIQYFTMLKERLTDTGVLALQAGDFGLPFIEAHSAIYNTIRQVMPFTASYRSFIPSFNTEWGFVVAAPYKLDLPTTFMFDRLIEERGLELSYFDGVTAKGMFSLPKDIRQRLESETTIIDDDQLITVY